ncbi:MAG: hypothetical protein KDD40_01715 [Bdellovibrionales bacterium]|nr:hypothetical protein [Bdellovibrionales bacterium]
MFNKYLLIVAIVFNSASTWAMSQLECSLNDNNVHLIPFETAQVIGEHLKFADLQNDYNFEVFYRTDDSEDYLTLTLTHPLADQIALTDVKLALVPDKKNASLRVAKYTLHFGTGAFLALICHLNL